jgi:hypothetical protein
VTTAPDFGKRSTTGYIVTLVCPAGVDAGATFYTSATAEPKNMWAEEIFCGATSTPRSPDLYWRWNMFIAPQQTGEGCFSRSFPQGEPLTISKHHCRINGTMLRLVVTAAP